MSYYKFGKSDLFYNTIKAYPKASFIIYSGSYGTGSVGTGSFYTAEMARVYYNNKNYESGAFSDPVLNVPDGHLSLYELNVDRPSGSLIYPYIYKGSDRIKFKTISTGSFATASFGQKLRGAYPLSASISRDWIGDAHMDPLQEATSSLRLQALKNTINFYRTLSPHFQYSNSFRNFDDGNINLISIPSIFYGSSIKKGSVDLKFYISGTLMAQARDDRQNGELIQIEPTGSTDSANVVGLVLYNEGFLILTGSQALSTTHTEVYPPVAGHHNPRWIDFGSNALGSSSYSIDFQGTSYTSVVTMMAHAPSIALNHSNNPTFLEKTSVETMPPKIENYENTTIFTETAYNIKNTIESPYNEYSASFQKQTYISRIGVYDNNKNLIAIAKVATPVRKREADSYTFKLKLDI